MEMEKKRWMLSALHNMDDLIPDDTSTAMTYHVPATKAQKILALHETQGRSHGVGVLALSAPQDSANLLLLATASYWAAVHASKQLYHMSASPLSHTLFPNIHPILVPSISPSAFPVAPQLFGSVYSMALPALVPSLDIPRMLRNVSRCLVPGGIFHLTLIDPMPCASALGPRMRAWLEDNLLINLERQFRCVNPSKLFPIWLADASLRGAGSAITTAKFVAVCPSNEEGQDDIMADDTVVKAQLRSMVGRMLWTEVWGAYVGASDWWWNDPDCVEECLAYNTHWEYSLIEAVRDI
jgi:hypothetical protein